MRIVVDKKIADGWKWGAGLTIFVRPYDLTYGERYLWRYILHELIEANLAKVICGGQCGSLCEKLLHPRLSLQPNPFKINTRGRAGICHVLTWLLGRW